MATRNKARRVLCNDDGWIIGAYGPPFTVDIMREKMIGPYEGSPVDVFLWSVGGHDVFDYETDVGERFGEGYTEFDDPAHKRKAENLSQLIREAGGPMTVITQLCREAGMEFFPSVRMNEHYDMEVASPTYSKLRREHPELLIGRPGEAIPEGTTESGIRTGLDYAYPEVRAHMTNIVFELFERWDVDGVELDFMRHPAHFRIDEAYANRYLATDLVRRIRQRMDEVGDERGKHLDLLVRVPPTLADSRRIGLDVEAWMKDGLVSIVVAGGGFIPFEMPIREFVEAAEGTGCQVYGCFEALRPLLDENALRALAARYWSAGVSGLYLFNYFNLSNDWKRNVPGKLADAKALARLDKRYELDHTDRHGPASQIGHAFRYAIPAAQLPVTLHETHADRGLVLEMDVADDLEAAASQGALGRCTLRLGFDSLESGDELQVGVNGSPLTWSAGDVSADGWSQVSYVPGQRGYPARTAERNVPGTAVELEVGCPPLKQGVNEIELGLLGPSGERTEPLVLRDVSLSVTYDRP